jgi:hypothetical protein
MGSSATRRLVRSSGNTWFGAARRMKAEAIRGRLTMQEGQTIREAAAE